MQRRPHPFAHIYCSRPATNFICIIWSKVLFSMLETQQECNPGKGRSKQTHSEILTNMTIGIAMQLHNPDGSVIMYTNTDRPNLPKDGTFVGRQMCLLLLKSTRRDRDHKLVMRFVSIHPLQQSPTLQQHLKGTTRSTAQTR